MKIYLNLFLLIFLASCSTRPQEKISLAGVWQFQIDPNDEGEAQEWFNTDLSETVRLPGSMAENDKGYDITLETKWTATLKNTDWYKDPSYAPYHRNDDIRFPFWLQPNKKYTGAAWYRRKVNVPKDLEGKNILLKLERPHWESTVWVNETKIGIRNSLAVPHVYNVTDHICSGENSITIRIDNRTKDIDVGENSHSISDHTQSNWNGIVGELALMTSGKILFNHIEVIPDIETKQVEVRAEITNTFSEPKNATISAEAVLKSIGGKVKKSKKDFTLDPGENLVRIDYEMGEEALLWDEFNPNVYQLDLVLNSANTKDHITVDFGFREFKVDGTRFAINGRPVFLRGTLECAIFPLTGYPPTETEYWIKIYKAIKEHGLNHVRFHSWCPPEAAFVAADSMGIYLLVECSSWANGSTELGSGLPIDQYIWDESERIVKAYGNHPSFVMMAYGNEPGGPEHSRFLSEFVAYWKEKDSRRLYTSGAGWPLIEENDYHVTHRETRIQGWGEGLNSIINSQPPRTDFNWSEKVKKEGKPVVSHEIGQWCVYPDFNEIRKYTGVLKPRNFEIFRESLEAHHMGNLAGDFLMASGKLQALCYKADIEAALRTPEFGGFQLLDLHDFPGQGTALVGVLDPFWEEKGYISPGEYRRFCNTTVPLARLEKRIFTEGEMINAGIEVAHFGEYPLDQVNPFWKLVQEGEIVAEGTLGQRNIPIGNAIQLGTVNYEFPKDNTPKKLTLHVGVGDFENSWDIWAYPEQNSMESPEIKVVEDLSAATMNYLKEGGKVLLSLGKGRVASDMGGDVGVGFSSIFWNTAWTSGQKPHTLGILCDPQHPAFQLFPTEFHSNWQWWDAMSHSDAIHLDAFPMELKPIVRIIDDWVTNRRLALLFEVKVGNGRILVSGADLVNELETRPEARQLRTSLIRYMEGGSFAPSVSLTDEDIKSILHR